MKKVINEYIKKYTELYKKYTQVKIFIPKKNGRPCIDKTCRWYVYFYLKNNDGTYKIFKFYHGINRYTSVSDRLKVAETIKKAIEKYLADGGNPMDLIDEDMSVGKALEYAYENKKSEWSNTTIRTGQYYYGQFIEWLKKHNLYNIPIKDLKRRHIAIYINELAKKNTNTTINNKIRFLATLFGKLAEDDIIDYNIMRDFKRRKEKPVKNEAYTEEEFQKIKQYLLKNDPHLWDFIRFMGYTFLRPIEIVRLRVGDIDIKENIIRANTKTGEMNILIIDKLRELLLTWDIEKYPDNYFLFSKHGRPDPWQERKNDLSRYYFFKKRFAKMKASLSLPRNKALYSFRHTFARMLFFKFINEGMTDMEAKLKLMTITRHKSLSSLNKYLRSIGAILPDDYSDDLII